MTRMCLIIVICLSTPFVFAQTIHLKNNNYIQADILKEDENRVVVDLGFDILQIPKSEIVKIERENEKSETGPVQRIDLYSSNDTLDEMTVEGNVARLGEAVVKVSTPIGLGSGFIIHKDGYVVTNFHVIEGEQKITITVFKRKENELEKIQYPFVKIVATNPFLDLALLKIEPKKGSEKLPEFGIVYLGNIDSVTEGSRVFCIGNPLGMERSVSDGIISSSKRQFNGLIYLQCTAPINPGNSGGPLFNLKGEVVGITNMKVMFGDNLGFAIPVNELKNFLKNRDAFLFDKNNPNSGIIYFEPPHKKKKNAVK